MNDTLSKDHLQELLSLYQSFVTLLALFLGFILATITLVSFLQAPIELRRLTLWFLLASFATMQIILVRTHSQILKIMGEREIASRCPPWNDELLTIAITLMCISLSFMLRIGGLTAEEAIVWFIISMVVGAASYILIYKSKHVHTWKQHSFFSRHFHKLWFVVGCAMILLGGGIPFYLTLNAPNYQLQPDFYGFGVTRNQTNIEPVNFIIAISADSFAFSFQYSFICYKNGTYNFLFVFPFKITSKIDAAENMSFYHTRHGSAIWLKYNANNLPPSGLPQEIFGSFRIDNTFQSGSRGSYMFLLPFGGAIGSEAYSLAIELGVDFLPPDTTIELRFGVSPNLWLTQISPKPSMGPRILQHGNNRIETSIGWYFDELLQDSIVIFSQDTNKISLYQFYLFIAGIFIGIGSSIIVTATYNFTSERRKKTLGMSFA